VEQHLRHLLDELSAAIRRSKGDDERTQLTELHEKVERRLQGAEGTDTEHRGLVDSLEKAEVGLESEHPSLAEAIRQAIQGLSSAGI
jgi:hypothetical protein